MRRSDGVVASDLSAINERVRNWQEWHHGYEDPSSSLSRRLAVVRRRVADVLNSASDPIRVLSLCAGDGRDLLPVLADRRPPTEFVVLVEKDPGLAETARRTAIDRQLEGVAVITGDAGEPAQYAATHPVDLLLLCGIFGNISEDDIKRTVAVTPTLLREGGTVIWTRGSTDPDLRPAIRGWFEAAGLREVAFEGELAGYGVGVNARPPGVQDELLLPSVLFRFTR